MHPADFRHADDVESRLRGTLHLTVAFDWGDEIDMARAAALAPASGQEFPRRRRTPESVGYRPPPLVFPLPRGTLPVAGRGPLEVDISVTVFDFGGVSVGFRAALDDTPAGLLRLAAALAESGPLVTHARSVAQPLFERLRPAIVAPQWTELSEEYFVFQLTPGGGVPEPAKLVADHADWLAGLVRLEAQPLAPDEVAEATRHRLTYTPRDLVVVDWSAAVVVDEDCEETLETIEFANLQLLEYRHIDRRVDDTLARAYGLIGPLARSWLPFWRTQSRPLRVLGELRIEANVLLERTSNTLKLVGDQYLARLYRLLAQRLHLDEWAANIRESLDAAEGVHQVLSDQAATYRIEFLEIIVIVLIAMEIVMALLGH